jgi:hypothetical protein
MIGRIILGPTPRPPWPVRLAANIIAVPCAAWLVMLFLGVIDAAEGYWFVLAVTAVLAAVLEVAGLARDHYVGRRR